MARSWLDSNREIALTWRTEADVHVMDNEAALEACEPPMRQAKIRLVVTYLQLHAVNYSNHAHDEVLSTVSASNNKCL